jgi:hypothetical protein
VHGARADLAKMEWRQSPSLSSLLIGVWFETDRPDRFCTDGNGRIWIQGREILMTYMMFLSVKKKPEYPIPKY